MTTTASGGAARDDIDRAWDDPKLANILYHDWEASTYDDKWAISYDDRCINFVRDRFVNVAGPVAQPYERSLEIGAGTGFFTLNLMLAGVIGHGTVTDLSPRMVDVALRNGRDLDLAVDGVTTDAEDLPFPDDSFDLVCGHAVLHHIPDLELALSEVLRVLKPGGRFVFAGEPTQQGDVIARRLSQLTWATATRATRLPGIRDRYARPPAEIVESEREAALESVVDIHTFDPEELRQHCLRAGAVDVDVATEEFTASWFGWPIRTIEAAVKPGSLGWNWFQFAYRGWTTLNWIDAHLWSAIVPGRYFYNVSVSGTKA